MGKAFPDLCTHIGPDRMAAAYRGLRALGANSCLLIVQNRDDHSQSAFAICELPHARRARLRDGTRTSGGGLQGPTFAAFLDLHHVGTEPATGTRLAGLLKRARIYPNPCLLVSRSVDDLPWPRTHVPMPIIRPNHGIRTHILAASSRECIGRFRGLISKVNDPDGIGDPRYATDSAWRNCRGSEPRAVGDAPFSSGFVGPIQWYPNSGVTADRSGKSGRSWPRVKSPQSAGSISSSTECGLSTNRSARSACARAQTSRWSTSLPTSVWTCGVRQRAHGFSESCATLTLADPTL